MTRHSLLTSVVVSLLLTAPAMARPALATEAAGPGAQGPAQADRHAAGQAAAPTRSAVLVPRPLGTGETGAAPGAGAQTASHGAVPGLIEDKLAGLGSEADKRLRGDAATAMEFYAARDFQPLWLNEYGFTSKGRAIARRLSEAGDDGLDPDAYQIRPPLASAGDTTRADGEIDLTLKALRFAREARQGRLAPGALGKLVTATPDAFDELAFLEKFAAEPDPVALLDAQNPQAPQFQALRAQLKEMRQYTASVERHAPIPEGPTLRLGMRDPAVPVLRARLDVPARAEADDTVFEPDLAAAVRDFQEAQGMTVDGLVGPRTREMLNAPVSVTSADIVANMERWRWLPRELGRHHVFVNIPEFKARVVNESRVTFETRVIVGKQTNRTPVFSDEIEYVDVNPYWNVPYSIATKEMLPQIRRDPGYLYREGLQVLYTGGGGAQLIDPMSVDWSRVSASNMPFRFRQPPGDSNALGRVKFMFPNKHAVYLHDTPARSLFSRSERALSHGCVRVDDPVGFADALLSEEPNLDGGKIQRLINARSNGAHPLKTRVPVHLGYFTVWAGADGEIKRWRDIYGYDREMKRLLGLAG